MSELEGDSGDMVVVRNVCRRYRATRKTAEVDALTGISLRVPKGAVVAIRGDSGSGKTTLLSLIGGLDRPDSGSISVDGRELTEMSDRELVDYRAHTVGFIFQSYYLFPWLSARENVAAALEPLDVSKRERRERAMEALRAVGMAKRAEHRPGHMSGGEQQRAGIARAIAKRPALILADEPTGNLDPSARSNVLEYLLRAARESATTTIIVTHDPWIAERCDVDHKIKNGRITKTVRRNRVAQEPRETRNLLARHGSALGSLDCSLEQPLPIAFRNYLPWDCHRMLSGWC
ncbi:MAG TPA: ABC transporter ATP-binding protein [Thermoplasmata archaeon]|nr:ABC transporter ATP-binding protein [Thermoplasmata archaeon]